MNSRYHLKWSEPFQALSHVQGMMQNLNTLQRGSIGHVGNLQYTSDCYLFVYFWHRTCKKTMALLLLCFCVIIGDILATLITFRLEQTHCFVVSLCVCVCWCLFSIFHAFGKSTPIFPRYWAKSETCHTRHFHVPPPFRSQCWNSESPSFPLLFVLSCQSNHTFVDKAFLYFRNVPQTWTNILPSLKLT